MHRRPICPPVWEVDYSKGVAELPHVGVVSLKVLLSHQRLKAGAAVAKTGVCSCSASGYDFLFTWGAAAGCDDEPVCFGP